MAGDFKPYPSPKAKPVKVNPTDDSKPADECKGMPKRMGAKMSPKR